MRVRGSSFVQDVLRAVAVYASFRRIPDGIGEDTGAFDSRHPDLSPALLGTSCYGAARYAASLLDDALRNEDEDGEEERSAAKK